MATSTLAPVTSFADDCVRDGALDHAGSSWCRRGVAIAVLRQARRGSLMKLASAVRSSSGSTDARSTSALGCPAWRAAGARRDELMALLPGIDKRHVQTTSNSCAIIDYCLHCRRLARLVPRGCTSLCGTSCGLQVGSPSQVIGNRPIQAPIVH